VVGGSEVFEDGVTGADTVGTEVREGGEGFFLVLEDKASDDQARPSRYRTLSQELSFSPHPCKILSELVFGFR
jgi:hypothetical protein